jgi:hypothetical protein
METRGNRFNAPKWQIGFGRSLPSRPVLAADSRVREGGCGSSLVDQRLVGKEKPVAEKGEIKLRRVAPKKKRKTVEPEAA